jgi:uncharacterized membrane protein YhiD involved in acid resistance
VADPAGGQSTRMQGDAELLLRGAVGAALGEALGTEREHRGQVAGCGRTAWWPAARRIFMLAGAYGCAAVHRGCNVDPMRVAAQAGMTQPLRGMIDCFHAARE